MNQKILNKLAENALEYSIRKIEINRANLWCEAEACCYVMDDNHVSFC